jgi:L-iditol 2-dehydrogenase
MKALLLTEFRHLEYTEFPEPEIAPDEVLVQVKACGVCGSDIHGYDGSTGRRIPPLVMGHELSGVIAAVGAQVKDWEIDERVTCDSTVYCGVCYFCRRGLINLCDNRRVLGVSTSEYRRHGAFAEYIAIPERILYKLPSEVTYAQAVMIEPLSIAAHAARITRPAAVGDSVVVVGSGMVGLMVVQVLKAAGFSPVIALDLVQSRLDQALQLGADASFLSSDPELQERILSLTQGRGADHAFEVVGVTAAVKTALNSLRKGGTLTLVGNLSPNIELPLQSVVTREIALFGSCASQGEYPACLDLIRRGVVRVDPMISALAPLQDGAAWFERLYQGDPSMMKVILEP